ncbi:MAG: hypothetical protein GY761_06605 [Hyphomicrobiales bacterium]|nr:hypothetical protein [Hyphomicrobiales bacterium]
MNFANIFSTLWLWLCKLLGNALMPSGLILMDADFGHVGIRRITELFAVTTLIADQDFGIQHRWIDQLCPNMIAELGFAQPKAIRHR